MLGYLLWFLLPIPWDTMAYTPNPTHDSAHGHYTTHYHFTNHHGDFTLQFLDTFPSSSNSPANLQLHYPRSSANTYPSPMYISRSLSLHSLRDTAWTYPLSMSTIYILQHQQHRCSTYPPINTYPSTMYQPQPLSLHSLRDTDWTYPLSMSTTYILKQHQQHRYSTYPPISTNTFETSMPLTTSSAYTPLFPLVDTSPMFPNTPWTSPTPSTPGACTVMSTLAIHNSYTHLRPPDNITLVYLQYGLLNSTVSTNKLHHIQPEP